MKKTCSKCNEEKFLNEFYKDKRGKDGRRADCGECNKQSVKVRNAKNPEKSRERTKKWCLENPEKVKLYRKENLPRLRKMAKERYAKDAEYRKKRIEDSRSYRSDPNNRRALQKTMKMARERNRQNPQWRIKMNLRRRMNTVLKKWTKASSTTKLVGCSWEELRSHIESKFVDGMSWDNYGRFGWHLDHIEPCSKFDFSKIEDQKKCFHYTNLQPLWWKDNIAKADKSMEEFLESLV